jgi:hypothetical protein
LPASTEVLVGDPNSQHVLLRPLSRSLPGLFEPSDGNWIDCEVHIVAGSFRGGFRADLRSEEFEMLLEQLEALDDTLEGTASFSPIEGQIAFSLSGDGKGHIRVSGEAIDEAGTGNRLQFGFDIDQTYVPAIRQSLIHLLAAFPVIRVPGV